MKQWLYIPQRKVNNQGESILTGKIKIINTDNVTHIIEYDNIMEFHLVNGKILTVYKEDYEKEIENTK